MADLANKRGIMLIACGHPFYGRMAYNLAMTIKAVDATFPIALAHSEKSLSHLSPQQMRFFDQLILLPIENAGFSTKLHLDELSPFEETLFLDADMAWMPKRTPTELFQELYGYEYTGITEGYYDIEEPENSKPSDRYYFWAQPEEIVQKYGLKTGRLYQWRSEVVYFKKTERVLAFFKTAREIHNNPRLESIMLFGEQMPDELPINISAAIHGIEPHAYKWTPALWPRMHGANIMSFDETYSSHYLLSCGSNYTHGDTSKFYDRLVKVAAYKFNVEHVFPLMNKRDFIPERASM